MGASCCCSSGATQKSDVDAQFSFFDSLPTNVEEATVSHVYDGDTLIIREHNNSRVRLLGVDAPALKPRERCAVESAKFVKRLCPKGATVWLQFDEVRKDQYERLLAYIFVRNAGGAGYICINVAVVEQGLAELAAPTDTHLSMREVLLKASTYARSRKLNIWKKIDLNKKIYRSPEETAFHTATCEDLKNCMNLEEMSVSAALDKDLAPCKNCHPM
ncbi:micrococcal nuclease [Strigomonas culicis]|uniref:Micrococcal nuclease n=1 Tax=Strigomonas culicis TaxID=28005 RepID=S9UX60_9TRYP|nr:micrococcal nuclease [Strigomonas culicis]|eukprot:EPY33468.1 micrococcal nuclease [Strigomonas culicis]